VLAGLAGQQREGEGPADVPVRSPDDEEEPVIDHVRSLVVAGRPFARGASRRGWIKTRALVLWAAGRWRLRGCLQSGPHKARAGLAVLRFVCIPRLARGSRTRSGLPAMVGCVGRGAGRGRGQPDPAGGAARADLREGAWPDPVGGATCVRVA